MKKEEVKKMLMNTKVYVNGKGVEIQKKLLELGVIRITEDSVINIAAPFIYIQQNRMTFGSDMAFFKTCVFKEIPAEEILNIQIDEEVYIPESFTQVLVKDKEDGRWYPNIFLYYSEKSTNYPYVCARSNYKYCIPYKGNEHLNGKTDDK